MSVKKMSPNYRNKLKAVIIGAGRIAAQFDAPKSRAILTHAHAFARHPRVELCGVYDINLRQAIKAAKRWGTSAYPTLQKMMEEVEPDIVSICTPDETHYDLLKKVANFKPRLVIAEKPITNNLKKTQEIIALYKKLNIPVVVNYSRRFDNTIEMVKTKIDSGVYGAALGVQAIYTKGTLHNGSHLIDLLRYLFGEVQSTKACFKRQDFTPQDPSVGGFLSLERCSQILILAADARRYSIFELDILFERGRIKFLEEGQKMTIATTKPDPLYHGYTILSAPKLRTTQLSKVMYRVVDNAVQHLLNNVPLRCTLFDAYKAQQICSRLLTL